MLYIKTTTTRHRSLRLSLVLAYCFSSESQYLLAQTYLTTIIFTKQINLIYILTELILAIAMSVKQMGLTIANQGTFSLYRP